MYSLGTHTVTRCLYTLKISGRRYVPTFSSYTDFDGNDMALQVSTAQWNSVLQEGNCKATAVSYIDSQGRKRYLFENRCSEIFEIKKKIDDEKAVSQLLKWKWKVRPFSYFHKMQGKLLTMDITCDNGKRAIRSCLLFKVAGSYNDNLHYSAVQSPRSCAQKELFKSTRTPARISTTKLAVKKTKGPIVITELIQSEATISATSTHLRTDKPITVNNTEPGSEIHPPASLPDMETQTPGTEATVPGIENTLATYKVFSDNGITYTPSTTLKRDKDEGENSKVSSKLQKKHEINWLVTGLIIAVAVLLLTLAASLFVLVRKRCKKSAQRNSGEFAMNIVYHGSAADPEYEEATLPSKHTCSNDESNCYNDGNLYESIDNLTFTGATAATYEYAYTDTSKVKLPDENDNKDQPQQPPVPGPVQNKYEVAFRMRPDDTCNSSVVEEYEDMSLTASENAPLVAERQKYVNLEEGTQDNAESSTDDLSKQVYEEMGSMTAAEEEPLVSENYVAPDSISTLS